MGKILANWKELSLFRKILLAVLAALILGFGVATPLMSTRKGMAYGDSLLYFTEENGVRRYAGRNEGKRAEFTVQSDGTIHYRWGDYDYGPYRVVEDPTAAPTKETGWTGIEIRREDEVLFRGGYRRNSAPMYLYTEDGEMLAEWGVVGVGTSSGERWYKDGREISEYEVREPGMTALLKLSLGPELTHRGDFGLYLLVTLLAAFNIFQICCPGFMFQLSLLGRVRDPEGAEPSDFYIAMERLEWIILTGVAAYLYWLALTIVK